MPTETVILDFSSLDAALGKQPGRIEEAVQNAAAELSGDPFKRAAGRRPRTGRQTARDDVAGVHSDAVAA